MEVLISAAPNLRRSRSICVTKFVKRNPKSHPRRTSLCSEPRKSQDFDLSHLTQLKVLEEDQVLQLVTLEEDTTEAKKKPLIEDLSSDFEQPLKVFRRAGTPDRSLSTAYEVPKLQNHASSCQALHQAVGKLYNLNDFDLEKIGEGFFSDVFKVVHKHEGKIMVLKRNKHRANRSSMLKEVQLMHNLHHKNILKYEGACVHEGQLHALTEYLNGGSLEQLIQSGSKEVGNEFPWVDRVSLSNDINEGLVYLHSRGIFHRDLTSKNILIRKCGANLTAVVADFGLAARIPKGSEEKLPQVGSPYWMSPECLKGKFYDQKSDTFSFGIILCEMIARVDADPDVLPRTENFGVDYLAFCKLVSPECPAEYLKVAFSCVTIDPEQRPSCEELRVQFKGILNSIKLKKVQDAKQQLTVKMNGLRLAPSEIAKAYKKMPLSNVGEEMSKLDTHYIPSPQEGVNPFLPLFANGNGRFVGNNFFYSCIEFNHFTEEDKGVKTKPAYRKTVSMIGQEPPNLETLSKS